MNGINLDRFQFEFDLTWMAFFQNAEGRTYARYGGRDDGGAESWLTKQSLIKTMQKVLLLHQGNDVQPISKFEPFPDSVSTPADVPTLKPMMAKRKGSSCIHCHDVKNSALRHLHDTGKLKKSMVFTYPSPSLFGLNLDPDTQNVVASVEENSPAQKAGIRRGDVVNTSEGQRILTFADFTRVLEFAPAEGSLNLTISRGEKLQDVKIELPEGWKISNDPSWRPSVGVVGSGGGFWGKAANAQQRKKAGLGPDALAIRVTFIWAKHAKEAGIKMNDLVVGVEGQVHDMNMRQFHNWLQLNRNWGDEVTLTVMRKGQRKNLKMVLPTTPEE
ncbi:zinc metallopeptidase RseP [Mariniblastus fucicola]|uniref:Zinc metallopeptidase RseP n=2 Tax=Mariniblastus fucicola TaxID=980251 RepID=A0A5B9PJ90_9BACT|nr:zinc metallopeptidase RseP [Mariniblastus fucicola]